MNPPPAPEERAPARARTSASAPAGDRGRATRRAGDAPKTLTTPILVHAADMPVPVWWLTGEGEIAAASLAAPGRTDANEDALAVFPMPGALVLAVVDGVGGSADAAEAARILLEELRASLHGVDDRAAALDGLGPAAGSKQGLAAGPPPDPRSDPGSDPGSGPRSDPGSDPGPARESGPEPLRGQILDALERANGRLLAEYRDAAAVVAIALVAGGRMRTIHVGDAAILLCGQRGKHKYQTTAHSPVGFALEAGWIGEREALAHEDRHLISNAVGARDMRIEIGPWIPMAPRDRLLLASDGLFDNLSLDETIEICRCGRLGAAASRLVEHGRRRMEVPAKGKPSKPDDLSLILYSPMAGRWA